MARKRGLQRDEVVATAMLLADREGLAAVTLARVATELGVRSPSLYSHVDGMAGLRRAMSLETARLLGVRINEAICDGMGTQALTDLAHAYRRFAHDHPGLYATLLPTPSREEDAEVHDAFSAPIGAIAHLFTSMGVPEERTTDAIRSFRSAVHGFVALEAGGGFGLPHDIDGSFKTLITVLTNGIASLGESAAAHQGSDGGTMRPGRG